MSRLVAAAALGAMLGACTGSSSAGKGPTAPRVKANGVKHAILPMRPGPDLAETALPAAFEGLFCTALFNLNDKQVACAEDVRTILRHDANQAMMGSLDDDTTLAKASAMLDAPRVVALQALGAGPERVAITAQVQATGGRVLGRFQVYLKRSGEDAAATLIDT